VIFFLFRETLIGFKFLEKLIIFLSDGRSWDLMSRHNMFFPQVVI